MAAKLRRKQHPHRGFRIMARLVFALTLFLSAFAGPAMAQDYAAFLGHWKGSGISETEDSIYFAVTVRDMDVQIEAVDDTAFRLTWTTVTRESGDPDNPKIKKKSASFVFRANGTPGVYMSEDMGDPLQSEPVWWSRIEGETLYTYMLRIREDGTWQVQKYTRTVTGMGMSLTYQRITDGEAERQVRGRLIKHGG